LATAIMVMSDKHLEKFTADHPEIEVIAVR
jgi:hypothetical protein